MNKEYYLTSRFANDEVYAELAKVSNVAALSPEERIIYDENLRIYRDNLATIQAAYEDGYRDGYEAGFKEGHEAGVKEGISRLVTNMFKKGLSADAIAEMTGLTIDEVGALK